MVATELHGQSGAFARVPLPKRFCNLDRLLFALNARGLDGIVATLPYNVFYSPASMPSPTRPTSRAPTRSSCRATRRIGQSW